MSAKTHKLFDLPIVRRATLDAFRKLDPRVQIRNPVMFVVFVGSILTTALIAVGEPGISTGFIVAVAVWLWFTVLFANFAEAMAEGRGKAQADTLRPRPVVIHRRRSSPARSTARPTESSPPATCARATSSSLRPATPSPSTAKRSTASPVSTNPPSPAKAPPSSAKAAVTAPASPAAPACCPTGSSSASA